MGTYISQYGEIKIPESRKKDFIADAIRVMDQGGLFNLQYTVMQGKYFYLLRKPGTENEDNCIDVAYNYFDNALYENAGISLDGLEPYSNKIGYERYNQVVQALYFLAESYSETMSVSKNDSFNRPKSTMQWIRYVLQRNVQFPYREDMWAICEKIAQVQTERRWEASENIRRHMSEFLGDSYLSIPLLNYYVVANGTDFVFQNCSSNEKTEDNPKISFEKALEVYQREVMEYHAHSTESTESQIGFLMKYIVLDKFDEKMESKEYIGLRFSRLLTPPIITKVISEEYREDFWPLWFLYKDSISGFETPFFSDMHEDVVSEKQITTEEYLEISSDDRLYWWSEGGDVSLSTQMVNWIEKMASRFNELLEGSDLSGDTVKWNSRLINLAASRPCCFLENLFYEFLGNLEHKEYRAAITMIEETTEEKENRNLIALLGNMELRKKYLTDLSGR